MRKIISIAFTIIFLILLFSCSQGYIVNTNAITKYPEGRDLYMSKCGGCHQLFDPNSYSKSEWNKIIMEMQKKSKIDDQQKNEIYTWILETKKVKENIEGK